jgi:hypothetical protein
MPHPTESGQANGTIIENHAVLEIVKDEEPRDRVGVLVHELSHYFFASAPIEWHAMRLEGALRAGGPRAAAALALMNEALATAIGNGVLEQRLRGEDFKAFFDRPQSFYATEDVDAAAKAILPLMRDYLADRRSLDRAFVDRYFSLVIARLGGQLDSLEARLRVSAYVAADAGLYATMNEAARWLDTRSLWHSPPGDVSLEDAVLTRHGYLNGVVLTNMRDRLRFSRLVPDIERLNPVPGSAAIACTSARHSGSTLYVVVTNGAGLSSRSLIALLEQARPCQEDSAVNSAPRPFPG